MKYLLLFGVWLLYFFLHSLLASNAFKSRIRRALPAVYDNYRLWYNAFAVVTLLLLFEWMRTGYSELLFTPQLWGLLPAILGSWIVFSSFRYYDLGEFVGIPALGRKAVVPDTLNTDGMNAWVRHPLYSGSMLVLIGVGLMWPSASMWVFIAATAFYLPFGIYWEEQKLIKKFGDDYRTYSQQVKRMVPGVW